MNLPLDPLNPLFYKGLRGAGPQGVEPRSMVPETIVLSIELQTLSELVDIILGPIEVNT